MNIKTLKIRLLSVITVINSPKEGIVWDSFNDIKWIEDHNEYERNNSIKKKYLLNIISMINIRKINKIRSNENKSRIY